jgi:hypothetical protein
MLPPASGRHSAKVSSECQCLAKSGKNKKAWATYMLCHWPGSLSPAKGWPRLKFGSNGCGTLPENVHNLCICRQARQTRSRGRTRLGNRGRDEYELGPQALNPAARRGIRRLVIDSHPASAIRRVFCLHVCGVSGLNREGLAAKWLRAWIPRAIAARSPRWSS